MDNRIKINQNINTLIKAIEIAKKNGYDMDNSPVNIREDYVYDDYYLEITSKSYYNLIFNHDFAKAFWGFEMWVGLPLWKLMLQQMVLGEEPLDYIYHKLNNKGESK